MMLWMTMGHPWCNAAQECIEASRNQSQKKRITSIEFCFPMIIHACGRRFAQREQAIETGEESRQRFYACYHALNGIDAM
jgi:hypothetical protein